MFRFSSNGRLTSVVALVVCMVVASGVYRLRPSEVTTVLSMRNFEGNQNHSSLLDAANLRSYKASLMGNFVVSSTFTQVSPGDCVS